MKITLVILTQILLISFCYAQTNDSVKNNTKYYLNYKVGGEEYPSFEWSDELYFNYYQFDVFKKFKVKSVKVYQTNNVGKNKKCTIDAAFDSKGRIVYERMGNDLDSNKILHTSYYSHFSVGDSNNLMIARRVIYKRNWRRYQEFFSTYDGDSSYYFKNSKVKLIDKDSFVYYNITSYKNNCQQNLIKLKEDGSIWTIKFQDLDSTSFNCKNMYSLPVFTAYSSHLNIDSTHANYNKKGQIILAKFYSLNPRILPNNLFYKYHYNKKGLVNRFILFDSSNTTHEITTLKYKYYK